MQWPLRPLPLRGGAVARSGGAAQAAEASRAVRDPPRQVSPGPLPAPPPPPLERGAPPGVRARWLPSFRPLIPFAIPRPSPPCPGGDPGVGLFALCGQVERAVGGIPGPSPASSWRCATSCEWQSFTGVSSAREVRSPRVSEDACVKSHINFFSSLGRHCLWDLV